MDRKAGYKECPRCGLRNKPSALQCDFCGLRFIAGEDWDENIQALEKMGGTDEKVLVDEDISKRIEATIVKREKIDASIRAKDSEKDEFDYFKKEPEPIKTVPAPVVATPTKSVKGPVLEAALEPRPIVTAVPPSPERIVIPEQRPVEATSLAEPAPEKKVVRRVVKRTSQAFAPAKASRRKTAFIVVLLLGLVWYLVAVMFGGSSLGRAGGWVMVTVSTMMVVAGSVELFVPKEGDNMTLVEKPSPESKPHEVLICPKCHELVKATDKVCPDCGSEFRNE
jgi:hypothetical protein